MAPLLAALGYSGQAQRKTKEGTSPPDRNAQCAYINTRVWAFQKRGAPVISVDTNKQALVGDGKNGGQEWRPQGQPERVGVDAVVDADWGKAIPYGVDDQAALRGGSRWVSIMTRPPWPWSTSGDGGSTGDSRRYPSAPAVLMTADGGGSKGSRNRLWQVALQPLANAIGRRIAVCHFPPGTSTWNKIEQRMVSHMSLNWRGRPLISHEVMVHLMANTTTPPGLTLKAALDTGHDPIGIKVTDQEFEKVKLKPSKFHGEWPYTIMPMRSSK